MSPDRRDEARGAGEAANASSRRDEKRAASLRANLQRRKAQARGRADLTAEVKSETSSGNDPRPD